VGGTTLASALATVDHDGVVVSIGNVAGNDFSTTVLPFILRGAKLVGVASASTPMPKRRAAWALLAGPWRPGDELSGLVHDATLETLEPWFSRILAGGVAGRVRVATGGAA
jgi:NADPH:quinone reductase-like Zn-dependent oxidoreductase